MKTGGSNEGKILTFAISGCSELMTIPLRTRAGRVSLYDLMYDSYSMKQLRTDNWGASEDIDSIEKKYKMVTMKLLKNHSTM